MDTKGTTIPILREPVDTMRDGPSTLKAQATPLHPVQMIQDHYAHNEDRRQKTMLAAVHGTHAPMRLEMEQAILSQFQRLPGLKSNFVGLETLLGRDEEIDFGDYLGNEPSTQRQSSLHSLVEARFGDKLTRF